MKLRYFKIVLLFSGLILLLTNCRTAGTYTSNPKGKMAFAGTEFQLTSTDSFFIKSWTDSYTHYSDSDGNRIFKENRYRGFGTYQCQGDSLELTFCNEDSISVKVVILEGVDSTKLDIQIENEIGRNMRPSVQLLNPSNEIILQSIIQLEDHYHFTVSKEDRLHRIRIDGFGLNIKDPVIDIISLKSGNYLYKMKTYNGYFAKDFQKTIWFKRRPTGIRYQLHEKKRYLPKKWGWNWINRWYRDY